MIWGGQTLRTARHPARVREESLVSERVERGLPPHPANALITKSGVFPKKLPWFENDEVERFIFTAPEGARHVLRKPKPGDARIVVLDEADSLAPQVLTHMSGRGMKNVLIEGGGSLIWEFARYIDAFHVTLTPWLAGGASAPTLMDGPGFRSGEFLGLNLVEVRRVGDELFLRYAAKPA